MLLRDRYIEDPVMQLFPDFGIINYVSHLAGLKPYYKYIMTKDESMRWNDKLTSYLPATLFVFSLIPIIFHKKIPKLNKFTSIKARVLFALFFLAIPVAAGGYISASSQAQIARKYQANFEEFKKYRLTGDVTYINKKLKFYQDM